MSFFYTTATLHHITPLPAGTQYTTAIKAVHDHEHLIKADPEYVSHTEIPRPAPSAPFLAPADSQTKRYKVTDQMNSLPKGLGLPNTVHFECELTDTENGVDWVVKAPMGLVQRTTWRIVARKEADSEQGQVNDLVEDGGEWALVETVVIEANRLLVPTVKSKCEGNWRGIQKGFVEHVTALQRQEG